MLVTLSANGGGAVSPASFEVTLGGTYEGLLNATASKIGHTLASWNTEADGTGDTIVANTVVTVDGDHTLYAQYTVNVYTVSFTPHPGVTFTLLNDADGSVDHGGSISFSVGVNTGYEGVPVIKVDGTEIFAVEDVYTISNIEGNKTVIASGVSIKTFTVTFNGDGGTPRAEDEEGQIVNYGGSAVAPVYSKTGYTFSGWDKIFSNITADVTVTAQWTLTEYDIDYVLNGGVGAEGNPTTYTYISPAITILPPERVGYTFDGWEEGEGSIPASSTGNKTFTAKWKANKLTVTLDGMNGESTVEAEVTYGEDFDLAVPLRESYIFEGWFTGAGVRLTDALGAGIVVWDSPVNITVYAHWVFNTAVSTPAGVGTAAEFNAIRDNLNRSFYLLKNISLADVEWEPIGDLEKPFTGNFDGKGFTVSGVKIAVVDNFDKMQYTGIFGCATGEIKDLTVTGLEIAGAPRGFDRKVIGGIAGSVGKITGCKVSGSIKVRNADHGKYVIGGVAGFVKTEISNCESDAIVSVLTSDNVFADSVVIAGGVVGYARKAGDLSGEGKMEGRNSSLGGAFNKMVIGGVAGGVYTVQNGSTQEFVGSIALTGQEHRVHAEDTVGIEGRELWHI